MKLDLLITKRRTIIPATPEDAERLRAIPSDMLLPVQVKLVRNGAHWRKFMALVAIVAENHPKFAHVDDVIRELKLRTGLAKEYITLEGRVIYELGSISHEAMDEGEFREWSIKARQIIKDEYFPTMEAQALDDETRRRLAEWERWE